MDELRVGLFSRVVSAITAVAFALAVTTPSWADALNDAAKSGQEFGQAVTPSTSGATADSVGNITLFPDSSAPLSLPVGSIFPGATGDYSAQTGVYGDDEAMNLAGGSAQTSLANDPSLTGDAYRVLTESSALSRPDLRSDPIWGQTDDVNNNLGVIAKDFGDCSQVSTFTESSRTVHVPDYQQCERIVDSSGVCEVNHNYSGGVIRYLDGSNTVSSCGDGCLTAWLGQAGDNEEDNYLHGTCKIYEIYTRFKVMRPDSITSVVLEYAQWDDYMQVWVGEDGSETMVWTGPNGNFPPETAGKCELDTIWKRSLAIDITNYFKNVAAGSVVTFKTRVSVTGSGQGYSRIRIGYDPNKALTGDEWSPGECLEKASGITDGFANGTITCVENPDDGTGCAMVDGTKICESMLAPSPLQGIPRLCRKVQVDAHYDFYKGQMECWTDTQGVNYCPQNDGGTTNSCSAMEADPKCGFVSSSCVGGALGASGTCYVKNETWDCGYDQAVPQSSENTSTQCAGPIRCMGGDCVNQTREASGDFYRAAATLDAAAYVGMDGSCGDVAMGGTCKIFGGDDMECKKAVGGIVNCCEKPDGVSLTDYITMLMAVRKLDGAVMAQSMNGTALQGSWEMLRQPITSTWSAVKQPFSSAVNSMMGKSSASTSASSLGSEFAGFQQKMVNKTAEWVGQTFGEQAKSALFSPAEGSLTNYTLNSTLSTVIGGVMTAYMIYQVTMILIQIIWQCEKDEFELGAKRELKSCHFVGSYCATKTPFGCIEKRDAYCCFNAPLSRILQEQIRPQLGLSWGEAENPECGAIPVDQLANVDWSRVNLDEWIGILAATGNLNTLTNINMDSVTGSGNFMNIDGQREDTAARTVNRLNGIDTFEVKQDASNELFGAPR